MDTHRLSTLAVSDSGFIFDPRTGHSYAANSTGLVALRMLKSGSSLAEIEQQLSCAYEKPGPVLADLQGFLSALGGFGLVDHTYGGHAAR